MRNIFLLSLLTALGFLLMSIVLPPATSLDRCPVPRSLTVQHVTETTAAISWIVSDSALASDLQWRIEGDPDWETIPAVSSPFVLSDLIPCVTYEIRVLAICDGSESDPGAIHTFVADGCCRIPSGLRVIYANSTSADIGWDEVVFAFAHHVRYRALDAEEWEFFNIDTNIVRLTALSTCRLYEVQVGSKCDLDSTEYSPSLVFQTAGCGACTDRVYCEAYGDDAHQEWIDSLAFGAIRLRSGSNDGYLLTNTPLTGIERKRPYVFHVAPGTTIPGAEFYLRMWIDLNQDGVFTDSTELLVDPVSPISASGWTETIVIADSVPLGNTRVRIALKSVINGDTLRPQACGTFLFGEVEDYCISIEDLCPEVQIRTGLITETHAVLHWSPVNEVIAYVYRYRALSDQGFMDPEITTDTSVTLTGLEKCKDYEFQILGVCVQDTSSIVSFVFSTACPNATVDPLPIASDVIVFPVPFSDNLTLSLRPLISGRATVQLFNMMGVELQRYAVVLDQDVVQQVQFSRMDRLPHGVYLIRIVSGNRRHTLKVVK